MRVSYNRKNKYIDIDILTDKGNVQYINEN